MPRRQQGRWWTISDDGTWCWCDGDFVPGVARSFSGWIQCLSKTPQIDRERVSLFGFSAGAYMATEILANLDADLAWMMVTPGPTSCEWRSRTRCVGGLNWLWELESKEKSTFSSFRLPPSTLSTCHLFQLTLQWLLKCVFDANQISHYACPDKKKVAIHTRTHIHTTQTERQRDRETERQRETVMEQTRMARRLSHDSTCKGCRPRSVPRGNSGVMIGAVWTLRRLNCSDLSERSM